MELCLLNCWYWLLLFSVILTFMFSLRACHMWLTRNHVYSWNLRKISLVHFLKFWNLPCETREISKFQICELGKISLLNMWLLVRIFRIWIEYGEIRSISLYSVRMREKTDQNNSEYGDFLRSANVSSAKTIFTSSHTTGNQNTDSTDTITLQSYLRCSFLFCFFSFSFVFRNPANKTKDKMTASLTFTAK